MDIFQILKQLSFKVESLIKDNKIGEPNFVRCIVIVDLAKKAQINEIKSSLLSIIELWFVTSPEEVELHEIISEVNPEEQTILLKTKKGQGALLTISLMEFEYPNKIDLTVIGSKGTMYFDDCNLDLLNTAVIEEQK